MVESDLIFSIKDILKKIYFNSRHLFTYYQNITSSFSWSTLLKNTISFYSKIVQYNIKVFTYGIKHLNHLDQLSLTNFHSIALSWVLLFVSIFTGNLEADLKSPTAIFSEWYKYWNKPSVRSVRWNMVNGVWLIDKVSLL